MDGAALGRGEAGATDVISIPPLHHEVINGPMTPRGLWGMGLAACHYGHHLF